MCHHELTKGECVGAPVAAAAPHHIDPSPPAKGVVGGSRGSETGPSTCLGLQGTCLGLHKQGTCTPKPYRAPGPLYLQPCIHIPGPTLIYQYLSTLNFYFHSLVPCTPAYYISAPAPLYSQSCTSFCTLHFYTSILNLCTLYSCICTPVAIPCTLLPLHLHICTPHPYIPVPAPQISILTTLHHIPIFHTCIPVPTPIPLYSQLCTTSLHPTPALPY